MTEPTLPPWPPTEIPDPLPPHWWRIKYAERVRAVEAARKAAIASRRAAIAPAPVTKK